jgi:hypothetical protein
MVSSVELIDWKCLHGKQSAVAEESCGPTVCTTVARKETAGSAMACNRLRVLVRTNERSSTGEVALYAWRGACVGRSAFTVSPRVPACCSSAGRQLSSIKSIGNPSGSCRVQCNAIGTDQVELALSKHYGLVGAWEYSTERPAKLVKLRQAQLEVMRFDFAVGCVASAVQNSNRIRHLPPPRQTDLQRLQVSAHSSNGCKVVSQTDLYVNAVS